MINSNLVLNAAIVVSLLLPLMAEAQTPEILFQEALYQEEVAGNLDKAITLYRQIVQTEPIARDLQAQVYLRLAFSFQKTGNLVEAERFYNKIVSDYADLPTIIRNANAQLKELLRQRQIREFKRQLQTLNDFSPGLRNQLEEQIKKLQEKILELEKQKPSTNATREPEAPKIESERKQEPPKISEVLSLHLYHVARNLYQQGFFVGARENLRKAVYFDPHNAQAAELMKEVEAMLSHQESPSLVSKKSEFWDSQKIAIATKAAEPFFFSASGENAELMEADYNPEVFFSKSGIEAIKNPDNLWLKNLISIIKSQIRSVQYPDDSIRYENGKVRIKQTASAHTQTKQLWAALSEAKEIIKIEASLMVVPSSAMTQYVRNPAVVSCPAEGGISYALLTPQEKQKLQEAALIVPSALSHKFPDNFLLPAQKITWQYVQEIPVVQGYQGKSLNFKFYSQGIHIVCEQIQKNPEIEIKIFCKKIVSPLCVIFTPQGPVEHPCILDQQSSFKLLPDRGKEILVRGIINPFETWENQNCDLIVMIKVAALPLEEVLLQKEAASVMPTVLDKAATGLADKDYSLRAYDIQPWQLYSEANQDSIGKTETRHFIVRFAEEQAKNFKLAPVTLKIVQNHLVVYGPPALHQKLETFLSALKEQAETLCSLSIYLLSLERYTLQQLLKNWQLLSAQDKAMQIYTINVSKEELMKQLQTIENIKFHYSVGSAMIGNAQKVLLKDCQIKSLTAGIHKEGLLLQGKVSDIVEGMQLEARPILLSDQNGILELSLAIHKSKGSKEFIYAVSPQFSVAAKIPEIQIQKANLYLAFQKGNGYMVAGFQDGEMSPTREFIFLVIPDILKNQEEKHSMLPLPFSHSEKK